MPVKLNKLPFPTMKRIAQRSASHCGPACLEMLLSYLNEEVSQDAIIAAAAVEDKINSQGTTITELGSAITTLYPDLQFWYKFNASITDLSEIINQFKYPVAVEWQGVFDYPDDEDDVNPDYGEDDDDEGHYSIVTFINTQDNLVLIADPERHYAGTDRHFSILRFEHRWWDVNDIIDPLTGKRQEIDDNHALFVVTPKYFSFPESLHLIRS